MPCKKTCFSCFYKNTADEKRLCTSNIARAIYSYFCSGASWYLYDEVEVIGYYYDNTNAVMNKFIARIGFKLSILLPGFNLYDIHILARKEQWFMQIYKDIVDFYIVIVIRNGQKLYEFYNLTWTRLARPKGVRQFKGPNIIPKLTQSHVESWHLNLI